MLAFNYIRFVLLPLYALVLGSCAASLPVGPVEVVFIKSEQVFTGALQQQSAAERLLLAATAEGLVAMDRRGDVIPAIAERWIVSDDGLSYIFRIRDLDPLEDKQVSAEEVSSALRRNLRSLRGTTLGLDLAKIDEIRAMTDRVIEIILTSPMPDFLRVLAQPELGIRHGGRGFGPMLRVQGVSSLPSILGDTRSRFRDLSQTEGLRQIAISEVSAEEAVNSFANADADIVLNGSLSDLPLANTGPLTRGTIKMDAALGLFGFLITNNNGFLADPLHRQALSIAVDRERLLEPFNVDGWQSTAWVVPPELGKAISATSSRWEQVPLSERRSIASQRVSAWKRSSGQKLELSIALPNGPGSDILFERISRDYAAIGIRATRANSEEEADLKLHDKVARFYSPRWFLNQLNCRFRLGLCSMEADSLVEKSTLEKNLDRKTELLDLAHRAMLDSEVFIPLGAPIRWSLVRGDLAGFEENRWAFHPLQVLAN